jgi:hypothetical protein
MDRTDLDPDDLERTVLVRGLLLDVRVSLDAAAGDLALLGAVAPDPLARDVSTLAEAIERELEALLAAGWRWQQRFDDGGPSS